MTERKKLTLTKPEANSDARRDDRGPRRAPVRGPGTAPRARQTAEEAAKAREERATRGPRFDDRQGRDRPYSDRPHGDRPHGDRPHSDRPRTNRPVGDRPDRPEGDRPFHDRPRFRDDNRGGEGRRPQGGPHGGPQWGDARGADSRGGDRGPARGPARDQDRGPDRRGDFRGRPDDRNGPRYDSRQDSRGPGRNDRDTPQAPRPPAQPPVSSHDDGKMRLSKLMSERGLASRREADEWIEQGWVRVEGQVVEELGTRVFPDVSITIDPLARTQQAERVTILINKPIGYVSGQAEDDYEPAVVLIKPENRWEGDRLPTQLTRGHLRHLAPAGRLDIDSTGLLVLTQDGRVAKALIGEDSGVEKEYLVRVQLMSQPEAEDVSKIVPPEDIELLRFGLMLDDRQLKPAKVSWQNEHQLRFVLREGRKRQIRRMCEQVGLKVVGLKRVRMGRIALGDLPIGQWRFLRPDERF